MALVGPIPLFPKKFLGKKILVTENTRFRGAWLALRLEQLGVNVYGYSNSVKAKPLEFEQFKAKYRMALTISNYETVGSFVKGS
jgi:nucleoside-diphosphate-sugar epimerase